MSTESRPYDEFEATRGKKLVLPARFYWDSKEVVTRDEIQRANKETGIIETEVIEKRERVDVPMIEITIDSKTKHSREVQPKDKRGREAQYERFMAKDEFQTDGTPLELWPAARKSQVETLQSLGVLSVEQLAEMPESHVRQFMGGLGLREKAKAFIANKQSGGVEEIAAKAQQAEEKAAALQAQLEDQAKDFAALAAKLEKMEARAEVKAEMAAEVEKPTPKRSRKKSSAKVATVEEAAPAAA